MKKILIDKADIVDTNKNLFTHESLKQLGSNTVVPVYLNYDHNEQIGSAIVDWDEKENGLVSIVQFTNFEIEDLIGKNLAPAYEVDDKDIEIKDGVKIIKKAKLIEVSVITSVHASNIPKISKEDL